MTLLVVRISNQSLPVSEQMGTQGHRTGLQEVQSCWSKHLVTWVGFLYEAVFILITHNGPVEESNIAARKRLFPGAGKTTWASTPPAPADWIEVNTYGPYIDGYDFTWPQMVTFAGSPPKVAILSCTNLSAKRWSCSPALRSSGGTWELDSYAQLRIASSAAPSTYN